MRFIFNIDGTTSLSSITDESSFSDRIFDCLGKSLVCFRDVTVEDNLEVIFRIAECISALDMLIETGPIINSPVSFTFQFENRFYFNNEDGFIKVFDRESDSKEVDAFNMDHVVEQRNLIISFVKSSVAPISPYVSERLIKRDIL